MSGCENEIHVHEEEDYCSSCGTCHTCLEGLIERFSTRSEKYHNLKTSLKALPSKMKTEGAIVDDFLGDGSVDDFIYLDDLEEFLKDLLHDH